MRIRDATLTNEQDNLYNLHFCQIFSEDSLYLVLNKGTIFNILKLSSSLKSLAIH